MQQFINYGFSGLTSAAIYAIAASGLVLTYTTTGVFNFAHGAMGMVSAFLYWELRFGFHWNAPVSLIVVLLIVAPTFGALLELGIMRRLEGTSDATKLVVTLSLLLGLLGAALWIWDPSKSRPFPKFYDGRVINVLNVRLPYHDVAALLIAGLVAIGMRLLLYRTRVGVSMRASVDDRSLATLNGARPVVSAMVAWGIGAGLAALAGILIAPTLTLSAEPLTLLIVNAYAAAMIGRLRSLPMTFVGALILGLANDYGLGYLTRIHLGQQYLEGFIASLPIIILYIVLLILPQARLRGHRMLRTKELAPMPTWRGTLGFCACVLAGAAAVSVVVGKSDLVTLDTMFGIAIIGLSMIPLIGFAGQISLCQLSFAAIGAIVVAHNGSSPLALLWAAVITGVVGAIIALPALRLSGIYLALSTAAFAVAMDQWFLQLPSFTVLGHKFDVYQAGSLSVPRVHLLGVGVEGPKVFLVYGAFAFCVLSVVVVWIRRSAFGERLLAMKDSPAACATLGLNLTFTKLAVFAVSAAIAGLGGAVYGAAVRAPDASLFSFFAGLPILLFMVVSGINSIGGALATGILIGAPVVANLFPSLHQLTITTIGFAGIGVGRNPNGFIASDIRPRWQVMLAEPLGIAGVIVALGALWLIRIVHLISNWPYALLSLAVLAVSPVIVQALHARRVASVAPDAGIRDVPLEWVGITRPFRPEDVVEMDKVLALPQGGPDGAA